MAGLRCVSAPTADASGRTQRFSVLVLLTGGEHRCPTGAMHPLLGAPGLHRPAVLEEESSDSMLPSETEDLTRDVVFFGAGSLE